MYYDFKSDDAVQSVTLSGIDELIEDIEWEFDGLRRYESLSIYTSYEDTLMILVKLCKDKAIDLIRNIEDYCPNKMVILTISYDGAISLQDAYYDDDVCLSESVLIYINDAVCKCSMARILDENEDSVLHYVYMDELS